MSGKTIRIYLVDGSSTGIRTAELSNWTGKAVVCPRTQLAALAQRQEAKRTGVYILAGEDPEATLRQRAYIGEGDHVWDRLIMHDKDASKDFWTQAVFFISKDENLTKAHVRYLERELIRMAESAGRVRLANTAHPDPRLLPESEVDDMQFFIEQMQLILPVLGFSLLQPVPTRDQLLQAPEGEEVSPVFVMNPVGTSATAREYRGEFIVLSGSTARKDGVASWESYRDLRDRLVQEGQLVLGKDGQFYVFQQDVVFSSPSAAASVVYAGNQNGQLAWKIKDTGTTYKAWKEAKLYQAGT